MRKLYTVIVALAAVVLTATAAGIWCHRIIEQNKMQTEDRESSDLEEAKQKDDQDEDNQELRQLSEEEERKSRSEEILASMTLEEKVAQLFIVTPEGLTGFSTVTEAGTATQNAINQYPIGGFIYMEQNLQTPEQVRKMIENAQAYSHERVGLPLFINVDEEGGTVTRFGNNPNFSLGKISTMQEIGATGDAKNAYDVGIRIGSFLHELGFNMNNAPDADVLTNPANTVIGSRSFGTDCNLVSDMVLSEMNGLEEQMVIPVLKHFPGHGATEADTHQGYAYTTKTLDELMSNELIPFINGINAGAEVIMAAHISCPNIIGDDTPTSLSKIMLTDILRGQLGYQGIIITDALNMGAIAEEYTSAQATVLALQAGADILLMPESFQESYAGILEAVNSGTLTEDRINESVKRIIDLKLSIEE
ncbi:MAG: glycoside hydrolase family 3 N-terminal domain-containing protein [Eubacteriales bacterium]|nr:glycoside hydrolase family 3 N-terminal domain-containing protein [Eubacteriales bacterium]